MEGSSGDSTVLSSTPFSFPLAGSGAFRQAYEYPRQTRVANHGQQGGVFGSYLDEVLALCFCDKRLQLRGREGVDEPGLRHNEKEDLGAGQDGQLVGLLQHRRR